MESQISFWIGGVFVQKKVTRRETLLGQMECVVPGAELVSLIEPH